MFSFFINFCIACAIFYNIHNSLNRKGSFASSMRKYYKHYFIVISMLLALDMSFSFILYRLPYYQTLKCFLMLWLSIPGGTGPHFIYNVYIKNIHNLFHGDIDTIIANMKQYYENAKAKYMDIINSTKKGREVVSGFKKNEKDVTELAEPVETRYAESSEVEVSSVVGDKIKE